MRPLIHRFNDKVRVTPECWLWTGSRAGRGYGGIKHQGKVLGAHRVSYELHKGQIPAGLFVMHSCDNPLCVNPDHLSVGTHLDNMRDMYAKGRRPAPIGLLNGNAKLTAGQIAQIATSTEPSEKLGPKLGVSGARIRQIRRANARQLSE